MPHLVYFASALAVAACLYNSIFVINEGHVGIQYTLGSLSSKILTPGLHISVPYITKTHEVQTTIQTDYVKNIPCGTSSGVTIMFDKVDVVNQLHAAHVYNTIKDYGVEYDKVLIFDKIAAEMNQFCSKHTLQEVYITKFDKLDEILTETLQTQLNIEAPGVIIRAIRLSKPAVPPQVESNYREIVVYQTEIEKGKTQYEKDIQTIQTENDKKMAQIKSEQAQNLAKIESEQEQRIAQIEATKHQDLATIAAEKERQLAKIIAEEQKLLSEVRVSAELNNKTLERDLALKAGELHIQTSNMNAQAQLQMGVVDIEHYKNMKFAEFQNALITPEYLALETAKYLSQNTKVYYGNALPQMFNLTPQNMFNNNTVLTNI